MSVTVVSNMDVFPLIDSFSSAFLKLMVMSYTRVSFRLQIQIQNHLKNFTIYITIYIKKTLIQTQ